MFCIKNGRIHDMVTMEVYVGDILVRDGKILEIGKELQVGDETVIYDAEGKEVFPGFVDAHSHLGLDGYGIGFEGSDINEKNDICTPHLRGIDGFNPMDPSIHLAAMGGVTCVGTGPGSANVLGGTFFAVKTHGKRVDDMAVKDPIAMKCAFGENPKRCYKDKDNCTRMSTAAKLREMLAKTREYQTRKEAAGEDPLKKPAYDMKLEAMLPVLNGEMPLKAHAHQANDILTAIRIAKEFQIKLTLEHCTEGHLIVEELAKEKLPCAVGPTLTHATKFELQNKSWTTPGILAEAGCEVSIITDAPVIPQQHLSLCAAMAVKAGMDEFEALKAITINPARHLGIADRVGSLEVGKDADIVVFSGSPLAVASEPELVLIDGVKCVG